jgi:hypothetical protein
MKNRNLFNMDGNKGGDYIIIEEVSYGMCHIEVGHACVVIFDKVVPLEYLTSVFNGVIMENCKTVKEDYALTLYDKFSDWKEPFKSKVRSKICQQL